MLVVDTVYNQLGCSNKDSIYHPPSGAVVLDPLSVQVPNPQLLLNFNSHARPCSVREKK